jgi:hypothetical protein
MTPDGQGELFSVTHGNSPWAVDEYKEINPGVYISSKVNTDVDFPLKEGYYTVTSLGRDYTLDGESLDLSLVMASLGVPGVFSADVNPDGTLSPVLGQEQKTAAVKRHGKRISYAKFW